MNYRLGSRKTIEFRLLIECCRWSFAAGNDGEIREFAGKADWPRFVQLCRRHRVQGFVQRCLRELPLPLPGEFTTSLSADAARIAEQNLRAAHQSALLLEAFTAAGIPLIFVKGLTLSKLAYGDPFVKMSQDIDVLAPAPSITEAAATLDQLGFRLEIPAVPHSSSRFKRWHRQRKESVWRAPDGLMLDLHSRLADSPRLIPGIGAGSPQRQVEVAPGIVLPTLRADELFAYLCVHGASSAWFRLKWIADLAALLNDCAGETERLYERSQQLGAGRAAAQALLLAAATFDTDIGSDLERRLAGEPVNRWLANAAWSQLVRDSEPTEIRLGTASIHLTQLFLLPGLGFKLGELSRQLSDMRS